MHYRRPRAKGETFFFTVASKDRRPFLCEHAAILSMSEALRAVSRKLPFSLNAFVLLPDHLHCIWTMPSGNSDFKTRWIEIQDQFGRDYACASVPAGRRQRGTLLPSLWQAGFGERRIVDDADFVSRVEYIHYNPVKHGLVQRPALWPHSTFGRYVDRGLYLPDWGSGPAVPDLPNIDGE